MKNIAIFLILIFLFNLVNSKIEKLTLKNSKITFNTLTESKKYQIIPDSVHNYLQIIVQGNIAPIALNKNKYIISYYQEDSNFEKRKQFSKSSQGKSVMWLNKDQIESNFYLSILCEKLPCDYSLNIIPKKAMKLSINEKYTYYVTEDNQESEFIIDVVPPMDYNHTLPHFVQIFAKGGHKLVTKLQGKKYAKMKKANGYIINIYNKKKFSLTFEVNANIGDLVTIGVIYFEDGISNMYEETALDEIFELDTLLKKDYAEKICYKMPTTQYMKFYSFNYLLERDIDLYSHSIVDNELICGELHPYTNEDFYSIQYNLKNKKRLNLYNPILYGPQYNAFVYEGESIAVIPLEPEDDYSFVNYYIFAMGIKKEIFLYECDTYPFCTIDKNNTDKITPIDGYYNSYSFSYKKKELNNKLNPINKKQKLLVLSCINGNEREEDTYYCLFLINIYTDRTKIEFGQIFNQYRFTREGNIDNYIINKKTFKSSIDEHGYLNIETVSGNISVITNKQKATVYSKDNKKLYFIDKKLNEFNFKIIANQNSVYYINYFGVRDNSYSEDTLFYGMHNGNYLFNIKNNQTYHLEIYTLPSEYSVTKNYPIYTGFYPLGCKLDGVRNFFENFTDGYDSYLDPIPKKNDFYQFIYKGSDYEFGEFNQDGFYVNKTENDSNLCLFYSSFFILTNNRQEGGIILEENIPRKVLFTQKYNELNFTFPISELNKDINIEFKMEKKENYKVAIFIKDVKIDKEYNINENSTIPLKKEMLENICKNKNQLCGIFLDIISEKSKDDKFLEIIFNTQNLKNQTNNTKI